MTEKFIDPDAWDNYEITLAGIFAMTGVGMGVLLLYQALVQHPSLLVHIVAVLLITVGGGYITGILAIRVSNRIYAWYKRGEQS